MGLDFLFGSGRKKVPLTNPRPSEINLTSVILAIAPLVFPLRNEFFFAKPENSPEASSCIEWVSIFNNVEDVEYASGMPAS